MNLHSQLIGREFLMRHTPSHEAYTYILEPHCAQALNQSLTGPYIVQINMILLC